MIRILLAAVDPTAQPGSNEALWILSVAGVLAGLAGAYLGYRGQSKSADVSEMTGVFDGQDKLIRNLQAELVRCHAEIVERDRRITEADQRADALRKDLEHSAVRERKLREELRRVLSDFAGLRMVVNDEVAREAAHTSETIARAALQPQTSGDSQKVPEES